MYAQYSILVTYVYIIIYVCAYMCAYVQVYVTLEVKTNLCVDIQQVVGILRQVSRVILKLEIGH